MQVCDIKKYNLKLNEKKWFCNLYSINQNYKYKLLIKEKTRLKISMNNKVNLNQMFLLVLQK